MEKRFYSHLVCFLVLICSPFLFAQNTIDTINVITYNIQTGTNYRSETPELLAALLKQWKIDFLCTQELWIQNTVKISASLPDYGWFGVGRDDGKALGEMGVIFYRKDKYELLEEKTFWLSETPEIPGSKSWGTGDPRMATWGKFRDIKNNKIFFVFNTHLDVTSSEARNKGALLIRRRIADIAKTAPVIITGDFNCEPNSQPYLNILQKVSLETDFYDSKDKSKTPHFGPSGTYNDFSTVNPTSCIDYVFMNSFFHVNRHGVINEKPGGSFISDHFPVFAELELVYPEAPLMPELKASVGDKKVSLWWDDTSEKLTNDNFLNGECDFEGYKLYRSKDKKMTDAELVPGSWNIPLLRKSLFQCDLNNNIEGYTDFGIVDGYGFYLGNNSGIRHSFVDTTVENGITYYYVLTAYDKGVKDVGKGISPQETDFSFEPNSKNVAIVTPKQNITGTKLPGIVLRNPNTTIGNNSFSLEIFDPSQIRPNHRYKIKFKVDTVQQHAVLFETSRYKHDLLYTNSGMWIYDITGGASQLVYSEDINRHASNNVIFNTLDGFNCFNSEKVETEVFDGLQFKMANPVIIASFDSMKAEWTKGFSPLVIKTSKIESKFFPWQYEIHFTGDSSTYHSKLSKAKSIKDTDGNPVGPAMVIFNQKFPFYVLNKTFPDSLGNYEKMDMLAYDKNMNGVFDRDSDEILVGPVVENVNQITWGGTIFSISFSQVKTEDNMPKAMDVLKVDFKRPYYDSDEIIFDVIPDYYVTNVKKENDLPLKFGLSQNYPNPFNPATTIEYSISQAGYYSLKVYNILGQEVAELVSGEHSIGKYKTSFNGEKLSSGLYIYKLSGSNMSVTKKMILVK